MILKNSAKIFVTSVLVLFFSVSTIHATELQAWILVPGGGTSSSDNYNVDSTIGSYIAGTTTSPSYTLEIGFLTIHGSNLTPTIPDANQASDEILVEDGGGSSGGGSSGGGSSGGGPSDDYPGDVDSGDVDSGDVDSGISVGKNSDVQPISEPEPEILVPAPFVDITIDPQYYIDRYYNEPIYKSWFDKNYPQYSSIYHAVGLSESDYILKTDIESEIPVPAPEFIEINNQLIPYVIIIVVTIIIILLINYKIINKNRFRK